MFTPSDVQWTKFGRIGRCKDGTVLTVYRPNLEPSQGPRGNSWCPVCMSSGQDYGLGNAGKCLGTTTSKGPTKDGCKIFWTYVIQSVTNVLCIVSTNVDYCTKISISRNDLTVGHLLYLTWFEYIKNTLFTARRYE